MRVESLSKAYQLYERPQDRLKQLLWGHRKNYYREVWALRNVSLDVAPGEFLGIVGRNGSGKSSLLQIIAGIMEPTSGQVEVEGSVAGLLELGAGINPELTGRENVYLNAAVLGMARAEIDARYQSIVEFAELDDHMDQHVKTYSSGMFVRLAFAVAVSVEPDILLVDEALGVGDEAFQRKCYTRIAEMQERGTTILFVTHSSGLVVELCDRALLLEEGRRLLLASPKETVTLYHKLLFSPAKRRKEIRDEIAAIDAGEATTGSALGDAGLSSGQVSFAANRQEVAAVPTDQHDPSLRAESTTTYASIGAVIKDPHFEDENGRRVNLLQRQRRYRWVYRVHFEKPAFRVRFGMLLKNLSGVPLGGLISSAAGQAIDYVEGGRLIEASFPFENLLVPGTYFANAGVLGQVDGEEKYLHRIIDAAMFRVLEDEDLKVTGFVDLSGGDKLLVSDVSAAEGDEENPVEIFSNT